MKCHFTADFLLRQKGKGRKYSNSSGKSSQITRKFFLAIVAECLLMWELLFIVEWSRRALCVKWLETSLLWFGAI